MKKYLKYLYLSFYLLSIIFIIFQASLSGDISSTWSGETQSFLSKFYIVKMLGNVIPQFESFIRKFIGHYLLFAFLGLTGFLFYKEARKSILLADFINLFVALLVAIISEVIQLFTKNRFGDLSDVLLDIEGTITLLAIIRAFLTIYSLKTNKNTRNLLLTNMQILVIIIIHFICYYLFSNSVYTIILIHQISIIILSSTYFLLLLAIIKPLITNNKDKIK